MKSCTCPVCGSEEIEQIGETEENKFFKCWNCDYTIWSEKKCLN
jgi:transposase-like protein